MPPAVLQAAETLRPARERLLDDPYARVFLRDRATLARCATPAAAGLTLRAFDRRYPGVAAWVLLRNRWYEEVLAAALADGVGQIVLLGAGDDTTALRLDLGPARLFEVDAAAAQRAKQVTLRRHGLRPATDVAYVAREPGDEGLRELLRAAGFDTGVRSLVVWYGESYFQAAAGFGRCVTEMAEVCAPGSLVLFDYLDTCVIDGSTHHVGAQRARVAVARRGRPYSFGLAQHEHRALLEPHGFAVRDHVRIGDLAARYGGPDGVWCSADDFAGIITARRR